MTDGVHHSAVVGGSNAGRVIACPPSRISGEPVPDQGTSYTERGVVLHKVMEDYLATGAIPDAVQTTPIIGDLREAADEAVRLWSLVASDVTVKHVHVELKLHLRPLPGAFGTTDVLIEHHTNQVTVLDWKFGVTPVTWDQLLFYAACAMTDKQTRHLFNANTDIHLRVIQPSERNGNTFKTKTVTVLDVFDFVRKLIWAVENGHDDSLINAGDHCKFCPVKPVCPELARLASQALEWNDPYKLDADTVGQALAVADRLEDWITSIRAYAHERLNGGEPVNGYKLVAKRATRYFKDELDFLLWWQQHGQPVKDAYAEPKMFSVAQIEKRAKKAGLTLPERLYEKRSSGTTIARESDPRPEVIADGLLSNAVEKLRALNLKT